MPCLVMCEALRSLLLLLGPGMSFATDATVGEGVHVPPARCHGRLID
jgi:hypothetical protein